MLPGDVRQIVQDRHIDFILCSFVEMYETVVYVGGVIADLGSDAVVAALTEDDRQLLRAALVPHGLEPDLDWKKVVAGRRLWNFDRQEAVWREIL